MNFCIMDLVFLGEDGGWAPAFPDCVDGFLLLADTGRATAWGLYQYSLKRGLSWAPDEPVEGNLRRLIESAKRYPPALAIARSRVASLGPDSSKREFLAIYEAVLRTCLEYAPHESAFVAEACAEETGYLTRGEWYWILGYASEARDAVMWVSDDFHLYENSVNDFEIGANRANMLSVAQTNGSGYAAVQPDDED